jgi:hypothetical protein
VTDTGPAPGWILLFGAAPLEPSVRVALSSPAFHDANPTPFPVIFKSRMAWPFAESRKPLVRRHTHDLEARVFLKCPRGPAPKSS